MGGWASYKLGLAHPDLFSQAMPLEGPPDCGIRVLVLNGQEITAKAGKGSTVHCSTDGASRPLIGNARWLPFDITQGGIDELVPAPSNAQQANVFKDSGERYTLFFLPADDHLLYALQDRFGGIVKQLGKTIPKVKRNPAFIHYRWYPSLTSRHLGIGTTTAYWVTHLAATTHAQGALATAQAHSYGIRTRKITPVRYGPTVVTTPLPATKTGLYWKRGARPAAKDRLRLKLSHVKAITIDAARARLRGSCPTVVAITDHRVRVRLLHTRVGAITLRFPKGRSIQRFGCHLVSD
jgi:hypothetical protein